MRPRGGVLAGHLVVVVIMWTTATVLAGAVAWTAVSRLGRDGAAAMSRPMTQSQVVEQLDRALPTRRPGHPTVSASPDATRPPQTRRSSRSWQVPGGTVGAVCRGPTVDLLYASPLDGWTYRLDHQAARTISVEFSRPHDTTDLVARCVHGVPTPVVRVAHEMAAGHDGESGE